MSTYEGLAVHSVWPAQSKLESPGWAGDFLEEAFGRILQVSALR